MQYLICDVFLHVKWKIDIADDEIHDLVTAMF